MGLVINWKVFMELVTASWAGYPQFLAKDAEKLLAKCEPLGLVIDFDIKHITKLIEETKLESANKGLIVDKPKEIVKTQ